MSFEFIELSLSELFRLNEQYQDKLNLANMAAARLAQLTYNMNRGENSTPMDDCNAFLPFPQRAVEQEQLEKAADISKQASIDFTRYYNKLSSTAKLAFEDIKYALFKKSK